jgi:hypothetical protein
MNISIATSNSVSYPVLCCSLCFVCDYCVLLCTSMSVRIGIGIGVCAGIALVLVLGALR